MADIIIKGVTLTPNPVEANGSYKIVADIQEKVYVLDTGDGTALDTGDGAALETGTE